MLATPVYFMRASARMAALVDRLRVFVFGNLTAGRLRNKIGVSMAVSWLRHGGVELTHLNNITTFLTLEMIPVSVHKGVSPLGASALASTAGSGAVSYTHLRAHGTVLELVCRLLLEKKKKNTAHRTISGASLNS